MTEPDLNHDDTATLQQWGDAYQMYKLRVAGTAESWSNLSDEDRQFWVEMSQRADSPVIMARYRGEWSRVKEYWSEITTAAIPRWDDLTRDAKMSLRRKYRSVATMEKHNAKDTVDWNLVQDYYESHAGPGAMPWVRLAGVLKDRWRDEYLRSLLGNDNLTAGERRAQQDEAIEWTRVQEYYRNQCHQGKWGDLSQTQKDNWRDSYRFDRDVTKEIKAEQSVNDQMARARDEIDRFEATSQAKDEWAKVNHYYNESCGEGGDSWTELGDAQRLYWRRKYRMAEALKFPKDVADETHKGWAKAYTALSAKQQNATKRFHVEETKTTRFLTLSSAERFRWFRRYEALKAINPNRHYYLANCDDQPMFIPWRELGPETRTKWRHRRVESDKAALKRDQAAEKQNDEGWTASLDQMKRIVEDIDAAKKRMDANPTYIADAKPTLSDAQMDAMIKSLGNDPVNHPSHYTDHPSGVECIQITEHMGFNLGNAVKYIWRSDLKGNALEDLAKAEYYIKREIERRKKSPW